MALKLDKEERRKLHEASKGRKAVKINWPLDTPAKGGQSYPLEGFEPGTRLMVLKAWEGGRKAEVKLDRDHPHLLHGLKGTRNQHGDYETEPEAVHSTDQKLLDAAGRQATVIHGAERRREERKLRNAQKASERGAPRWLKKLA